MDTLINNNKQKDVNIPSMITKTGKKLLKNKNALLINFPPDDLNKLKDFEKINYKQKKKPTSIKLKKQKENLNITTKIIKGKKVDVFD